MKKNMINKIMNALVACMLAASLVSCTAFGTSGTSGTPDTSGISDVPSGEDVMPAEELEASEMFSNRDKEVDYSVSESVTVTFTESGAKSSDTKAAQVSGSTVTLVSEGTYIISGKCSDGQIVVNTDKSVKVQIVLDGVDITCKSGAALYVKQTDKAFVTLADGSQNRLISTSEDVADGETNVDAAVFSKEDVTFNGSGTLEVSSTYGHGIVSKDDLVFTGGAYTVTAASHALCGKDCVKISDGSFTLTADKDGVHAENADDISLGYMYIENGTFTVVSEGDAFSASAAMQLDGGTFNVKTGGGSANSSTSSNRDGG